MQDPHDSATDIAELLQHLIQLEVPQLLEDGEPAARAALLGFPSVLKPCKLPPGKVRSG